MITNEEFEQLKQVAASKLNKMDDFVAASMRPLPAGYIHKTFATGCIILQGSDGELYEFDHEVIDSVGRPAMQRTEIS
jgi:hypothetical protein